MKEGLLSLADGALETHKSSADHKQARAEFRRIVQAAYDMGVEDTKKAQSKKGTPDKETAATATPAPTPAPAPTPPAPQDGESPAPAATPPNKGHKR